MFAVRYSYIQHILVRNQGTGSTWETVDNHPNLKKLTQKIIRLPQVKNGTAIIEQPQAEPNHDAIKDIDEIGQKILPIVQLEFPRLSKRERDKLNAEGVSFREALSANTNRNGRKAWPMWERGRLYTFTTDATTVFAETGVLP